MITMIGQAPEDSDVVLVDPDVEETVRPHVLHERDPTDATHRAGRPEVLLPGLVGAEACRDLLRGLAVLCDRRLAAEVLEVKLVQPHPVELPAKTAAELGGGGAPHRVGGGVIGERGDRRVRVLDVALVEADVVLEERLAEPRDADQTAVVARRVGSRRGSRLRVLRGEPAAGVQ
jgi:hypothetical protein